MRVKSIVFDFKKDKLLNKDIGKHCIVINLYFFRIWLLDDDFISMMKKVRQTGVKEGQKILKN